jgi:chromate transporter
MDQEGSLMMRGNLLWTLLLMFVPLSLLSFGGGQSIIAPLDHQVVMVHRWITQREFVDMYAISRAAPGPGSMLVVLIGWRIAQWPGALISAVGIYLPSSLLCYGIARMWNRYRGTAFHTTLEKGLAPVGTGLLIAGAWSILRASETGYSGWTIAVLATVILLWRNFHPLLLLFIGGTVYALVAGVMR